MTIPAGPRALVIATFLSLSAGFLVGYGLAPRGPASTSTATEAAPHSVGPDDYVQLGMRSLEAGDYAGAERYFRRATELVPENAAAHTDLAVSLMYQERWTDAREELEIAGRLAPETPEVYFLQGVVSRDGMNDLEGARASWERFLALVPPDSPQASTVETWLEGLGSDAGASAR